LRNDADFLQREVLPRVASGVFCVLMLAAVSSTLALLLAYVHVYGFTTEGFAPYTRQVGRVFNAPVTVIFTVKTLLLAFAVALTPIAGVLYDQVRSRARDGEALQALVRVFLLMLLIEAASLLGNYY
jgi:phospholipid/cholesterol/gamma-HCH transport system permease protein